MTRSSASIRKGVPSLLICAASLLLLSIELRAAQIPPVFISSVVALGYKVESPVASEGQHPKWFTEGTGFFYGYLVQDDADPLKRQYEIYLVTARHVVEGHAANVKDDLSVRLDAKDSSKGVQDFQIAAHPGPNDAAWFYHPDNSIDVAVLRVDIGSLREQGFDPGWFAGDLHAANIGRVKELGISAGDGVFVLGFPMNLAGEQRNYVILRHGVIARIDELLDGASRTFMMDALVYPGNSGGPVVLKPDINAIQGTKAQSAAYLIGMVLDYRSYVDRAVSEQTHHPRIVFEENSGLADVLPVDYIVQAIVACRSERSLESPTTRSASTPRKH
jgi:S1-C subfamily serine protease